MEEYKKKNASYEDFDAMGGIRTRDVCLTSHIYTVRLSKSIPYKTFKPEHVYYLRSSCNKWSCMVISHTQP